MHVATEFMPRVPSGALDVSIIICTYNRSASLSKVLNDVKNLRVPQDTSYETLIIDNNSRDDTRATVEAASKESPGLLRYIFEPRQGKSFALNTAVKSARGEIIVFTDDDVRLDIDWLVEIKRAFDRYDCMGVAGRILPQWHTEAPWWYEEDGPYRLMAAIIKFDLGDESCECRVPAWGSNVAFRRSAFAKYGEYRLDLGRKADSLIGGEDVEFWLRLSRGGEKLIYAPSALVYHPVEERRVKRDYFLKYYFDFGRTIARLEPFPEGATYYFGVPRYLFRQMLKELGKWLFCPNPKRRFYFKLQCYQIAGVIVEARSRSRAASV